MAQLRSNYDKIQALNSKVVVITFGTEYWVNVWLQEMQVPFLMLLDQQRAAYRAYGLKRSMLRSWGARTFWRYAQLLLSGRQWRGIQGDSGQLGGDFIVDSDGILQFAQPSRDPTDRPSASQLLEILRQLRQR